MTGCNRPRLGGAAALVLALGSLSPTLFAQQQKLDREIVFVRALAREMRFIELAKEETDRLRGEFRGSGEQDRLAQLAVEISYYGAKAKSDRALQRTLFKEAIDKSKELIDSSGDPEVQLQARATLADASQEFGQFLIEELEIAREEAPDKVKELEEEAATVFRAGIEACGKVMENLATQVTQAKDSTKEIEYYLMWMRKGVLMREQARAVKADRAVLIERAKSELTDLVLKVGEETAIGLRGLFEIAQCDEVGGNIGDAISFYKDTIEQIATSLQQAADGELDLPGEVQGLLFEMLQEVYLRTGEVMTAQGDPDTGKLFEEFRKHMATFGEKQVQLFDVVDPRWGHLVLLAEARFAAESGEAQKVSDALAMAQRVNDKHPSDYVGVKAKAVLRDILKVQSSLVSGKLLFEVAKGEYQNKNYETSIKGLRRAIGAMSAEEAQELGLESYQMLGFAFAYTDRYLESMLALSEGLSRFGKTDEARASDTADTLDRAVGNLKRQTKNDPAFDELYARAGNMIAEYSVAGASKLFWKTANNNFNDKKYQEAITEYEKVTPDFLYYELARIRIAKAQVSLADFAAARKTLDAYKKFAEANPIEARESGKTQARAAALAEAEFTLAQMGYWEARGSEEFKLERQVAKYPEALQQLKAYVSNFAKTGSENIPAALESIGRMHADLGELGKAEEAYAQLKDKDGPRASRLATEIFSQYQDQVKALAKELDEAIAKDADSGQINAAKAAADAVRSKLVALGMDYISNAPKPQLAVLVNTLIGYEELGDWKKVDEVAQKTLTVYGDDNTDAVKRVVDLVVRPKIGEALLQQQKFEEAYPMLLAAEAANPTQWELKRQIARCLGGWFEFSNAGQPVRIAGLDKPDEAYKKYYGEYRQWALRQPDVKPFSLDWYRFHWECYWFAKQAGVKDTQFKDIAAKFYRIAKATDDFKTLKSYGLEGLKLFNYFQINR